MYSADLHSPALFFARRPPPERALIAALMLVSTRDALTSGATPEITERRRQAWRWIESTSSAPFSWLWCCDMLDLDPQRARAQLAGEPAALRAAIRARHRGHLT